MDTERAKPFNEDDEMMFSPRQEQQEKYVPIDEVHDLNELSPEEAADRRRQIEALEDQLSDARPNERRRILVQLEELQALDADQMRELRGEAESEISRDLANKAEGVTAEVHVGGRRIPAHEYEDDDNGRFRSIISDAHLQSFEHVDGDFEEDRSVNTDAEEKARLRKDGKEATMKLHVRKGKLVEHHSHGVHGRKPKRVKGSPTLRKSVSDSLAEDDVASRRIST